MLSRRKARPVRRPARPDLTDYRVSLIDAPHGRLDLRLDRRGYGQARHRITPASVRPTALIASAAVIERRRAVGVALVVLSSAAYAAGPLFAKGGVYQAGLDWLTLLAWRFLIGASLSWVWLLAVPANRAALRALPRRRVLTALALGTFFVGNAATYYAALETVDASLAALLLYIYPVLVAVISIRFGARLIGLRPWAALMLAVVGAVLALGGIPSGKVPPLAGLALAIASPVIYSGYIVLTARFAGERRGRLPETGQRGMGAPDVPGPAEAAAEDGPLGQRAPAPAPVAALMLTATATVVLALAFAAGRPILPGQVPAAAWPGLLGIGIITTAVAIQAFYAGTARIGAAQAALVSTMEPIWTIALATTFLEESLTDVQIGGGVLVIGAVLIAQTIPGTAAPMVREE